MDENWECIVVGGGAAGLSAALVLGRARRRTLVVDAGAPSNLVAHGIGGALGHDGRAPADLYALGRSELEAYPTVEVRTGEVVDTRSAGEGSGFELTLADGSVERTDVVLLALGMEYLRPDLPGVEERWGGSVFHCPFCHGWEVRDRPLGVLDPGPMGATRARLLRAWSDDVTLFVHGGDGPSAEERESLAAAGVAIEERAVVALEGPGADLERVVLDDGSTVDLGGLLIAAGLRQRSDLARRLGAATTATPIADDVIQVDELLRTTVPGVWAAGDSSGAMPSVVNAIATGSLAAAQIVHHLMAPHG
jgi:thioredoxin reductase